MEKHIRDPIVNVIQSEMYNIPMKYMFNVCEIYSVILCLKTQVIGLDVYHLIMSYVCERHCSNVYAKICQLYVLLLIIRDFMKSWT